MLLFLWISEGIYISKRMGLYGEVCVFFGVVRGGKDIEIVG